MNLTEAKTAARQRGETMRPISGKPFAHTATDIADIVESVLSVSHPIESMPKEDDAFNQWRKEQDVIRGEIWDAFAEGVNTALPSPAAVLGKLGGTVTTDAKAAAARENGKRGGRPRKQ